MTIVNPTTGRTFDHDRMLAELEDWTRQPPVISAMVKNGVGDVTGIKNLVAAVRLAIEGKPEGLTETQAAGVILQILASDRVRAKVARRIAQREGLADFQAEEGLIGMAEYVADKLPEERAGNA